MANASRRIYNYYKNAGYLEVPGYYNTEGKDYHCKICNWENTSASAGICHNCDFRHTQARKANKIIAGSIPVCALKREEWQVFQAIATQIAGGETPFATVEEYADECKASLEEARKEREEKKNKTLEQRRDAILYDQ